MFAAIPARADGAKRPMALMIMVDGLRADASQTGDMPNLERLRTGKWQPGYKAAWSVTGHIAPGSIPSSAPNHVSIATGFTPAEHGVNANSVLEGGTASSKPTWLKRVMDAKSGATALFVYSWSPDGNIAPSEGFDVLNDTDAANATALAARLASAEAPDATMYFIDCVDAAGHSSGFYPMSTAYRAELATADGYIGACLDAIASRPTFAEEDWLVLVTSDHGGYNKYHGQITENFQAHTVPIVIAGTGVTAGRIPGIPYNFDVAANALAHFGVDTAGLRATARDGVAEPARTLNDGLAAYLPFDADSSNQISGSGVSVVQGSHTSSSPDIKANGFTGKYMNIPAGGFLKLAGSENLAYEGGDKSFTAALWVNVNSTPSSDPVLIGNKNWSGATRGILICHGKEIGFGSVVAKKRNHFMLNAGDGNKGRIDVGPFDQENGKWTFYAMTRNNDGVITMYQGRSDGTLDWASTTFDGFALKHENNYPFYIGEDGTGIYGKSNAARRFAGGVDDVALWTRGLSHDEIARIFECGRAGVNLGELLAGEAHGSPEMETVSNDDDTVVLAFGGLRNCAHRLYIAYGATDGGADKYAWDNFDFVSEIGAGDTSYTYAIPQEFKIAGYRFRFFLLKTDGLPYAKEVGWAHSDGGAWIDTGVAPRRELVAEFDVRLSADNARDNGDTADKTAIYENFFGAYGHSSNKFANYGLCRYHYTESPVNETWDREYNHPVAGYQYQFVGSCTPDTDYHVVFSPAGLRVNGEDFGTDMAVSQFVESGWPIALYRNLKEGEKYDQTMIGCFRNFALYTPKRKARSFKPVATAGGETGMFDEVSGRFFASSGTALTPGADLDAARVGWVRAQSASFAIESKIPVAAVWTGGGADAADLSDPDNWICRNLRGDAIDGAIPTAETEVFVAAPACIEVVQDVPFACKSVKFENAVLAGDVDLRGLSISKIAEGSVFELAGHTLRLRANAVVSDFAFSVGDSTTDADNPGTLSIGVPYGTAFKNTSIAMNGNLRFAKTDAGTFIASKNMQSYTGGTIVEEGTLKFGVTGADQPFGAVGSRIEVAAGAIVDTWSRACHSYHIVLAGGKFLNTRNTACNTMDQIVGNLTLTADSEMVFDSQNSVTQDKEIANNAVWDLGGKTLTITFAGKDPDLRMNGAVNNPTTGFTLYLKNGTMKTVAKSDGSGWWHDIVTDGSEGGSYDISTQLRHFGNGTVSNLVFRMSNSGVNGTGTYSVYGTFTPLSAYGGNVKMLDGSTIDLSSKTGAWAAAYKKNTTNNTAQYVTFGNGEAEATITVKLAGRGSELRELAKTEVGGVKGGYVITWDAARKPASSVKFVLDDETAQTIGNAYLAADDGGLRFRRRSGFRLIIR